VRIPAHPAEHYFAITAPINLQGVSIEAKLPCVRDFDAGTYAREFSEGLLIGGFEPEAKPAFTDKEGIPSNWKDQETVADWGHFSE